jgi:hypothetical protein
LRALCPPLALILAAAAAGCGTKAEECKQLKAILDERPVPEVPSIEEKDAPRFLEATRAAAKAGRALAAPLAELAGRSKDLQGLNPLLGNAREACR